MIATQIFVATIFILKLFYIQIHSHSKYKAMAEEQYWNLQDIPAKRGDILTGDGYPLATTQIAYLMYAEVKNIENPEKVASDLANIVIDANTDLYETEDQKKALTENYKSKYVDIFSLDLNWAILEHYLGEKEVEKIENLNIKGIGFEEEPKRYYPEGTLASHVLGFVAKNEAGEEQGYFGIEGYLNGDLRGKPGRIIEEKDALGDPILIGGYKRVESIDGRDVVLTINRAIQYMVEKKLEEGVRKYGAESGTAIVMDPLTGDVLAMANFPTYHPERFNEDIYNEPVEESTESEDVAFYKPEKRNYAISVTYEPGSVVKPFTVSSGIDLKKITPQTTFEDSGPVNYSGYTIDNWDGKHHGVQTIIQLLQKSNNIGSAWVGHVVGAKNLHNYFEKFGFGVITHIDLEGEDTGIIRPYKEWTDIDLATAAFGQGISATPLQVLTAFNAIANEGSLMRPRIVTRVIEDDDVLEIQPKKVRQVLPERTAETMDDMLREAVAGGESKYFNIKDYHISGKTGTAQIPVNGKYDPDLTNATFVGYLTNSKKFSMLVKLEKPSSSTFAAETAVPLWMSIADDLIKYFGIAPDL